MKPIALEWVRKADGDFATAQREFADKVDAAEALETARKVRATVGASLGLQR
ncbi:MAG: hypothetical protein ACC628_19120 [Pirellulaceae bacterium]